MYISSADFMTRNMERRVEVACPILQPEIREKLHEILDTCLQDNAKARILQADGRTGRVPIRWNGWKNSWCSCSRQEQQAQNEEPETQRAHSGAGFSANCIADETGRGAAPRPFKQSGEPAVAYNRKKGGVVMKEIGAGILGRRQEQPAGAGQGVFAVGRPEPAGTDHSGLPRLRAGFGFRGPKRTICASCRTDGGG